MIAQSHSVHVIQATVSSDADDETSARTFPEETSANLSARRRRQQSVESKAATTHGQRMLIGISNSSRG